MSMYQRRLDAIMENHDCNTSEAIEIMKFEFAHDELPLEDEIDLIMRGPEEDD